MTFLAAAEPLAKSGEAAKAGPIGLGVILLLIIACYFLFKSMSKHLRTVRDQFPEEPPPPPRPGTRPLSKAEFTRAQAAKAIVIPPPSNRAALEQSDESTADEPEAPAADD